MNARLIFVAVSALLLLLIFAPLADLPTKAAAEAEMAEAVETPETATDNAFRAPTKILLVGAAEYVGVNAPPPLYATQNDVEIFSRFFTDKMGVPETAITILSDTLGRDDPTLLPTRANIQREFARLAETAGADDFIFIHLGGHGSQVPERSDVPSHERYGMDSVFLPLDFKNYIRDHELGQWIHDIRKSGAFVWYITDSCHSGGGLRGGGDESDDADEVLRSVTPQQLGISQEAISTAYERAQNAQKDGTTQELPKLLEANVAFYAALPFQPTFSRSLPPEVPKEQRTGHGLFSYYLCKSLEEIVENRTPCSYEDLLRGVEIQYASLSSRNIIPVPLAEGEARRLAVFRNQPVNKAVELMYSPRKEQLNAGLFHGMGKASVVEVFDTVDGNATSLGFLQVEEESLHISIARPVAWQDTPAPASFPPYALRCELVKQCYDMNDKIRVALDFPDEASAAAWRECLFSEAAGNTLLEEVQDSSEADFLLRKITNQPPGAPRDDEVEICPLRSSLKRLGNGAIWGPYTDSPDGRAAVLGAFRRIVPAQMLMNLADRSQQRSLTVQRAEISMIDPNDILPVTVDVSVYQGLAEESDLTLTTREELAWIAENLQPTEPAADRTLHCRDGETVAWVVKNTGVTPAWMNVLTISGTGEITLMNSPRPDGDNAIPPGKEESCMFSAHAEFSAAEHDLVVLILTSEKLESFDFLTDPAEGDAPLPAHDFLAMLAGVPERDGVSMRGDETSGFFIMKVYTLVTEPQEAALEGDVTLHSPLRVLDAQDAAEILPPALPEYTVTAEAGENEQKSKPAQIAKNTATTKTTTPSKFNPRPAKTGEMGRRAALLISVNNYRYLRTLHGCNNDMVHLKRALIECGFQEGDIIHLASPGEEVTINSIGAAIRDLKTRLTHENDLLLIAFSGHGVQMNQRRYLCHATAQAGEATGLISLYKPADTTHEFDGVLNFVLENNFPGKCLMLIDACRDGGMVGKGFEDGDTTAALPEVPNVYIFSSCSAGEVSFEEPGTENAYGRFIYHVSQGLRGQAGGGTKDMIEICLEKLHAYVLREMEQYAAKGEPQKPRIYNTARERENILIGQIDRRGLLASQGNAQTALPTYSDAITRPGTLLAGAATARHVARKQANLDDSDAAPRRARADIWPMRSFAWNPDDLDVYADVIQLPGLNGQWWFQEMPWYLPMARLAMAHAMSDSVFEDFCANNESAAGIAFLGRNLFEYANPNTRRAKEYLHQKLASPEAQGFLAEYPLHQEIIDEIHKKSRQAITTQSQFELLDTIYSKLGEHTTRNRDNLTTMDIYTRAVICHQLATLIDREKRHHYIKEAELWYQMAEDALKKSPPREVCPETVALFYQMCLADYMYFLSDVKGDAGRAAEKFEQLSELLGQRRHATLFQVAIQTAHASQQADFYVTRDAWRLFSEIQYLIQNSVIHKTPHPLVANFHEQHGWFRMDYWQVSSAMEAFRTAKLIRECNEWSSGDPADSMYVTYGLHGMGTIARFNGDERRARESFEEALKKINQICVQVSRTGLAFSQNRLAERKAATLERLADLTLYGRPTREMGPDYWLAAQVTKQTATTKPKMIAKQVLLMARPDFRPDFSSGRLHLEEAAQCLKTAEPLVAASVKNFSAKNVIPILFYKAADISLALMKAVEAGDEAAFLAARDRMRNFLDQFMLFSGNADGLSRDAMELRLFCSELLLDADEAMKMYDFALLDADYLSRCLIFLSEKDQIHPFLRRYFERMLYIYRRACVLSKSDAEKQRYLRGLAITIQRMRNVSELLGAEPLGVPTEFAEIALARSGAELPVGEAFQQELPEEEPAALATMHHLVDPTTVVIFYFPYDDSGATEEYRNGIVLLVPNDGGKIEMHDLGITRQEVGKLTDPLRQVDSPAAKTLETIRTRILQASEQPALLTADGETEMARSVFISWSDEVCWPSGSFRAISSERTPFSEIALPTNIIVR